ncbi:MAG: hypothetical protein ACFFAS_11190 [Promethearchaeota archaeon]
MSKKYNLPLYGQLSVTCGISTFLMLINPEKNQKFASFLDDIYNDVSFFMKQTKKELKWSVAITYILLKSLGNNLLNEFLYRNIPDIVDYYMPIVHYQLSNKNFSKGNKVTKNILRNSLNTMRTDADLKILFYLFGGKFFPQKQDSYDGTGGLYFSKKDFKQKEGKYEDKINLLGRHLNSNKSNTTACIALNVGYHWVAVNGIDKNTIGINNPLSSNPTKIHITSTIPEHYRFYLFNYNQKKAFILKADVREFLKREKTRER